MKFKILNIFVIIFCLVFAASCSDEANNINIDKTKGYSFSAEIKGYDTPLSTRVTIAADDDMWSYKSFETNDKIGFYSSTGNADAPDGNGTFDNEPMYFQRMSDGNGYFINTDMDFNLEYFVPRYGTFYYFPYHEKIEYDPTHTEFLDDDYGLELRRLDNGIEKCLDFLWVISASSATSSQTFNHAFSSIVFLRDEGFENAEDKTIKVVLNKGVSHVTVTKTDDYLRNCKLLYLDGYDKSEMECRNWFAWQGGDYLVVDDKSDYFGNTYSEASYIVLPTTRGGERLSVDHIELYDNDGRLRIVSDFQLYTSSGDANNSKILYFGQRYPLVIKMRGVETVVTPLTIEPWDEDVRIEEIRESGITQNNFQQWILDYSSYLNSDRQDSYDDVLKVYGDKTENSEGVTLKWTFYLKEDIDVSDYIASINGQAEGSLQYVLSKLDDTLDGEGNSITGLTLSGPNPPSFIGELTGNGVLRNINFQGINLHCTDSSKTAPMGGLFSQGNGTVSECKIDGVVSGFGPVGLIAGSAQNARIENCIGRGVVIGSSSSSGNLIGIDTDCVLEDNNTAALIFQSVN